VASALGGVRSWILRPRVRDWLLLLVAAFAAFELVLDFRILPPTAIDWIFSFGFDTAQYYLAFAYYRNSAWHFPLTDMETMLHPVDPFPSIYATRLNVQGVVVLVSQHPRVFYPAGSVSGFLL
jgi:hypothetical protein